MEFWGSLGAGAAGALITGVFLILQQRRVDKRDDIRRGDEAAQRDREREHQLDVIKLERSFALKDAWRDERRNAHAALFLAMRDLLSRLDTLMDRAGSKFPSITRTPRLISALRIAFIEVRKFRVAFSTVRIVGGEESVAIANECRLFLRDAHFALMSYNVDLEVVRDLMRKAQDSFRAYIVKAREDMESNL